MQLTSIRPLLLGIAAVVLAYLGQRALQDDSLFDAAVWFGAGALLFVVVFWRADAATERPLPLGTAAPLPRGRLPWIAAALTGAAVLLSAIAWRRFYAAEPVATDAWWLHIASVAAALIAARLFDGRDPDGRGVRVDAWPRRLWTAVAAVVLVALFFRLFRFNELPFGTWYDEAEHGLQALRILETPGFRPIFEGAINGPAHYLYLTAAAFTLFGESTQSIRLVSVLFGVLTVPAGYLVGSELFGRRVGLVLAFLLAVSGWLVTLSRFGMYATTTTPLFTLWTAGFLLRALRTQRIYDYALAGLGLGLGLCFYTSFRLFVPVIALFLLHYLGIYLWRQRQLPAARFWAGLGMLALVAILVVAPVALYAYKHPEIFWARVEDTFIFASRDVIDRWAALADNVRRHLLMFNWRGDPNGRHNLPGSPMLDSVSATLLALGAFYALRRAADPRFLLLLLWPVVALLGGILSLSFEAPQSLRANGALPPAYILATVPVALLWHAWDGSAGRFYPQVFGWVVGVVMLLVAGLNFHTYFVRQAGDFAVWNAYSTPETLAAHLLAGLAPDTDAYVTAFFHGHPTIKFLARDAAAYRELNTTDYFPLDFAPGRNALLVLNADSRALYDEARRVYPDAHFEEIEPPVPGPPVLFVVRLAPADIASIQGLNGRYYANTRWEGEPALVRKDAGLDFDWHNAPPVPPPFSAEWTGVLHASTYGRYDFFLQSPAHAELRIGEQVVISGTGILSASLPLAEGNHFVRVRAASGPGRFSLAWRTPDGAIEPVPATALYTLPLLGNGLLGRYYANGAWATPETYSRIDARFGRYIHVTPLPRPYTVEWTGKIAVPQEGIYRFALESIDESTLWIDAREVVSAATPNVLFDGEMPLNAGLHDIRIRFADRTDHTHINLYWQPPGGAFQLVPPDVLFPPQGNYARVSIPELAAFIDGASPIQGPQPVVPPLAGTAHVMVQGLQLPRGIAVDADGRVYVAEAGSGRVVVYATDGVEIGRWEGDGTGLLELSDLALQDGDLLVLDAGAGRLHLIARDGQPLGEVPTDQTFLERSRGLFAGNDGRIWIANTAGSQIVALYRDGTISGQMPVWAGDDAQPVDLAIGAGGDIFVVDGGNYRLVRYTAAGQQERTWSFPAADTLDSPHIAADSDGFLYMTEPETGHVVKRSPSGDVVGAWNLAQLLQHEVRPVGIAVGPGGRIWVTDVSSGKVIAITPGNAGNNSATGESGG
ncbi:MAG: glycosyltransferase family 39 protein [Caldilineaceae bacterium]|nr:glycosyltransferase family 39 protein [Caldilineaceae bacterium]